VNGSRATPADAFLITLKNRKILRVVLYVKAQILLTARRYLKILQMFGKNAMICAYARTADSKSYINLELLVELKLAPIVKFLWLKKGHPIAKNKKMKK
jgi:hypothetical protein